MATKTKQKTKATVKTTVEIPEALAKKCKLLRGLSINNNWETINFRYTLGESFNDVINKPDTYGKNAREVLQKELGIKSKKDVDTMCLFAREYTKQEIKAYEHRYDNVTWAKTSITWSHWIRLLVRYLDKAKREEWMDKTVRNGWNANDLAKQLSLESGTGPKHGRKVKQPGSKAELCYKMTQPLTVYKNLFEKVWKDKDNPASIQLTHDFDDVDVDAFTQLSNLQNALHEAEGYIQYMLKELESLKVEELWSEKLRKEAEPDKKEEVTEDAENLVSEVMDSVL